MKKQFTLIAWITLIMILLLSSCQKFEGDAIQKLAYGKDESGRHFVDLGLSVKWATCNIGAEAPEQQGLLYAWGETTPKEEYTWDNYKFGPDTALSKYCAKPDVAWHGFTDTKTTLELSDDAAHVNWQGRWRMPTQAEWKELIEKCTWTQTEYMGVKGYDVKAANGNRIFLPAPDESALYASSSLLETRPGEALHLPIFDQYDVLTAQYRYRAYSVRAVYGPVLPQYCLVNFDANGGEGIMHPQQFSKGALIPLTEVRFTKQASVFSSWNTKADGSGTSYKDKASIITDKSFTLYAQWTPCYTITFDANGGEGIMDSLTIVSGTKKPLPANTFTRSGYVFAAWNTAPDGSGTAYKESSEIAPTENLTLYAQWTPCYTITFDANGGEGIMDSLTIVSGTKKPLPANTFTRSGYVFAAWNTAPDGSGTAYKESSEIEPSQNMTLYAQWTRCYTITFDANGGEGTMDSLTIVQGEECQLPANTFTRNGYIFAGWNTKADGSGSTYNESSKIAPTEDLTLYAQWTQRIFYRVTFNANGGNGTMADQVFEAGVSQTLVSNTFIRSGYSFIGWNTAPDGSGTSYTDRQVVILTEDITLYAQWMEFKVESAQINASAVGIVEGGSWLSAGTVLSETPSIVMSVGADDIYKLTTAVVNDMTRAIVGWASIDLSIACQGSINPKDAAGGNCDVYATVPASGAFFTFDVKKDGYLYVVIKASSNKTYLVSEEGTLIGYDFAMYTPNALWGSILRYTLKGEGEYNQIVEGSKAAANLIWPEKIALGNRWESAAGETSKIAATGVAVIKFPVFAGCRYTVNACGAKIVSPGFFFVHAETDVLISDDAGNKVVLYETGVSNTNYYNVTFNANGGEGTMSKQRFKEGVSQ